MLINEAPNDNPAFESQSDIPALVAAELQDNLMTASNDLERLQRLLSDTCEALMQGFYGAAQQLAPVMDAATDTAHAPQLQDALQTLYTAITALQFQDMASQLITHTNCRLRNCADRLAADTLNQDEDGAGVVTAPPLRPNPVTQDEMDAGSVELF